MAWRRAGQYLLLCCRNCEHGHVVARREHASDGHHRKPGRVMKELCLALAKEKWEGASKVTRAVRNLARSQWLKLVASATASISWASYIIYFGEIVKMKLSLAARRRILRMKAYSGMCARRDPRGALRAAAAIYRRQPKNGEILLPAEKMA